MKPGTKRLLVLLAICTLFTVVFCVLYYFKSLVRPLRPLQNAEFSSHDWLMRYGRTNPADPNLILIGIDRLTYANVNFFQTDEYKSEPALKMM